MFRLWIKLMKENRLVSDITIPDDSSETRTHKIFNGIEKACAHFDVARPIWLDATVADFKRTGKARFTKDNFMEPIDFDYMEVHVIEED